MIVTANLAMSTDFYKVLPHEIEVDDNRGCKELGREDTVIRPKIAKLLLPRFCQ